MPQRFQPIRKTGDYGLDSDIDALWRKEGWLSDAMTMVGFPILKEAAAPKSSDQNGRYLKAKTSRKLSRARKNFSDLKPLKSCSMLRLL